MLVLAGWIRIGYAANRIAWWDWASDARLCPAAGDGHGQGGGAAGGGGAAAGGGPQPERHQHRRPARPARLAAGPHSNINNTNILYYTILNYIILYYAQPERHQHRRPARRLTAGPHLYQLHNYIILYYVILYYIILCTTRAPPASPPCAPSWAHCRPACVGVGVGVCVRACVRACARARACVCVCVCVCVCIMDNRHEHVTTSLLGTSFGQPRGFDRRAGPSRRPWRRPRRSRAASPR